MNKGAIMSRRNNSSNDVMDALGCLFLLIYLPLNWLYNWLKTPITTKIHKLDDARPQIWGESISGTVCPQCQIISENSRRSCFNCGATLPSSEFINKKSKKLTPQKIFPILLGIVIFYFITAYFF